MLQSFLLEGAPGPRLAAGSASGVLALLHRAVLSQQALRDACRSFSVCDASQTNFGFAESEALSNGLSSSLDDDLGDHAGAAQGCEPRSIGTGPLLLASLRQHLPASLQQQRGLSTSTSTSATFASNLTRYPKSKVANRDNYERWNKSGRDVRVAQDILREGGGPGSASRGGGGRQQRSSPRDEFRALVLECRNLQELQVLVREGGRDMDAPIVCMTLSRLPRLRQVADASSVKLARRLAESLMVRLQEVGGAATLSHLASGLAALSEVGVVPGRPLLELVATRLAARSRRGTPAAVEADARTASSLLQSAAKFANLQRNQAASSSSGAGKAEQEEGGVLQERLWPTLRFAAEAKLLRALGEEPEGAAATPVGGEEGPEVDDAMPQNALRIICKALALAHDTHLATWSAALRLTVRHVAELEPAVQASILRSYAIAGGHALDGDQQGLVAAVWGNLGPIVRNLDVTVLLDLTYAAVKLALAEAADGAAGPGGAVTASQMLRPLCDALTTRVPNMTCADVGILTTGMAEVYSKSAAAPSASAESSFGALPRLVGDLLLMRGPVTFDVKNYCSVALALALMGHGDRAFWSKVDAAMVPEVARLDGKGLSRLLGALHAVGTREALAQPPATASARAGAGDSAAVAAPAPVAVRPSEELLTAAYARTSALLKGSASGAAGAAGGISSKEALHVMRCLADWPLAAEGAAAASIDTWRLLADKLAGGGDDRRSPVNDASPAVRQRVAGVLRAAGLGEHPLVVLLTPV